MTTADIKLFKLRRLISLNRVLSAEQLLHVQHNLGAGHAALLCRMGAVGALASETVAVVVVILVRSSMRIKAVESARWRRRGRR